MFTRLTALRTIEKEMDTRAQIEALRAMTTGQLRDKYAEIFGELSRSYNRQFLFRRVAWRIQALAEGGLSERARRRALEIANDAERRQPDQDSSAMAFRLAGRSRGTPVPVCRCPGGRRASEDEFPCESHHSFAAFHNAERTDGAPSRVRLE